MSLNTPIANSRNQRPRVTLRIPEQNAYQENILQENQQQQPRPHSPFIMSATTSGVPSQGQPNWPNPIVQQLYSQRAGDFVFRQFEGLNRFTKGGLSVGEKSVVYIYAKFRAWSRNWFTHIFLFIVVLLYSIAGSLIFMALEVGGMNKPTDNELWLGSFRKELGEYEKLLYDAYAKGQFDNAELKKTWTFFNSMFFCGTIYTTIANDSKYIVRGILNVGPPSPAGSVSSSSSSSGGNAGKNGGSGSQAYRAKILSKKEKSMAQSIHRSQSTSRQTASCQTNSDIFSYLRRAKRSLSAPRKREGSTDSGKSLTPQMQEMKISMLERENYTLSNKTDDNDEKNVLLDQNLRRFEEERRQFEREKLKFLEDKRELDRLRLQRFERYKRELEAKRIGLKPNYDIDNPYDYMIARKVVIDYKMNEKLMAAAAATQDSGSESEPDITVVENVPKDETIEEDLSTCKVILTDDNGQSNSNTITLPEVSDQSTLSKNHLNGKDLPNGTEKSSDQKSSTDGNEVKMDEMKLERVEFDEKSPMKLWPFIKLLARESRQIWSIHKRLHPSEWRCIKSEISKCLSELVLLMTFCGMGGLVFRYYEGNYEMMNKTGVKRVKRDFIDQLWLSSHNLREEDWKSMARTRLRKFEEELQSAIESGMKSYSGHRTWNFVNGVLYCLDLSTTIGYGHISPVTVEGRIFTMVYAIIGIPVFLILLADFGKLFTRVIKFVWVFVRRLYYTGSCRKVRKTVPTQDVMRGLNVMYDFMRRPSLAFMDPSVMANLQQQHPLDPTSPSLSIPKPNESPMTPLPENLQNYEIDDEFNLPISVAIIMLLTYMLFGAAIYCSWEDWNFFEAFYFVFVSISTIGFGDLVPTHPIYMMASIIYLIFGLALTSMCINVVQVKLSDHFRQASSKIIGAHIAEAVSQSSAPHSPTELQSVHSNNSFDNNGTSLPTNDTSTMTADKNTVNTNSRML
ncbi:CLUMA_CG021285, isoform B [Clunio marinus]|uniref:CLUMA_CG021285, isoform B n=1 Tax=Clunio marinus TaxID=568069 RepID=A0A1J1J8X8_9DIPT|nr:CLUMA_CG021285, isoform B [Clunio marinus]